MKHLNNYRRVFRRPSCALGLLCWAALIISVRNSYADATSAAATVIMMTSENIRDEDEQFRAIRAQLSGSPIQLERHKNNLATKETADNRRAAAVIARETGACLVFWIETTDVVRTYYFIPNGDAERVIKRTLRLEEGPLSSRIELIAVAIAGMLERLYVTHQITPASPRPPAPPPAPDPNPSEATRKTEKPETRAEITTAYVGRYFAKNIFAHGIRLGAAFLPNRHLALTAAFSYMFPRAVQDEQLALTLTSRMVEIAAAARWIPGPLDIRLGAAAALDLRSFSAKALSDSFQDVRDGLRPTVSLIPFLSLDWVFAGRFGLFAVIGANVDINETAYEFSLDGTRISFLRPFPVKLLLSAGLVIKI